MLKFNPDTRPYLDVDEMNQALISNWNSVVSPEDTVYNLGDLSFSKLERTLEVLSQLNGHHILIRGNHDQPFFKQQNIDKCLNGGYLIDIKDYHELRYNGEFIVMSHYSMRVWNHMHRGAYMLYGHSHGFLPGVGRSMDVGIDSSDMPSNQTPFLLDDVLEFLRPRSNL